MTRTTSRLLVIDTSVARSAGETEHPVSAACRETLLAVLNICHRVALTNTIRVEWHDHMSNFTRKWLRSMVARKKAVMDAAETTVVIDDNGLAAKDREIIEKDRCLLEAALSADRIIITRDESFRNALGNRATGIPPIVWRNPETDGTEWLRTL